MLPFEVEAMLPTLPKWVLPAIGAVVLLVAGLSIWTCTGRHRVAVAQADQHHDAATISAAQGAAHDQEAQDRQAQLTHDAATVAQLRSEVQRLRLPHPGPVGPPAAPNDPQPVPAAVDLAPLVAKQDQLIQALTTENTDLKAQNHTLTLARDSWRLTVQENAAEAVQLRAALAAQQGLTTNALWKGRLQGLAVGLGSGYLVGRLR